MQWVIQSDPSIAEVAEELEINPGTLGNWVNKHRQHNPEPEPGLSPADHVRLAALEEQDRKLKKENEFLKKRRTPRTPPQSPNDVLFSSLLDSAYFLKTSFATTF